MSRFFWESSFFLPFFYRVVNILQTSARKHLRLFSFFFAIPLEPDDPNPYWIKRGKA
jgi:hypothetical protein